MPNPTCKGKNSANTERLITIGGRLKSGKNASANFIAGINLVRHGLIDEFNSNDDGSISVDGKTVNVNDIAPHFIKLYGWADGLKHVVCNLFNLSLEDAFGTDADKRKPTHIRWEDMPGVMTNHTLFQATKRFVERKERLSGATYKDPGFSVCYHEPGFMSIRDILQYFGTDICRKIYSNCWINYLMNTIKRDSPRIAIIYDSRFDNEVEAVKATGGKCIYLTRNVNGYGSEHASENGFVSFNAWDAIIDNQNCADIRCLNKTLYEGLVLTGVFNKVND